MLWGSYIPNKPNMNLYQGKCVHTQDTLHNVSSYVCLVIRCID